MVHEATKPAVSPAANPFNRSGFRFFFMFSSYWLASKVDYRTLRVIRGSFFSLSRSEHEASTSDHRAHQPGTQRSFGVNRRLGNVTWITTSFGAVLGWSVKTISFATGTRLVRLLQIKHRRFHYFVGYAGSVVAHGGERPPAAAHNHIAHSIFRAVQYCLSNGLRRVNRRWI